MCYERLSPARPHTHTRTISAAKVLSTNKMHHTAVVAADRAYAASLRLKPKELMLSLPGHHQGLCVCVRCHIPQQETHTLTNSHALSTSRPRTFSRAQTGDDKLRRANRTEPPNEGGGKRMGVSRHICAGRRRRARDERGSCTIYIKSGIVCATAQFARKIVKSYAHFLCALACVLSTKS